MTNGEKFMEVFGVGCATYDVMHDITTIHRNGDWWDTEYEGEEEQEPCEDFKQKAGVVIEQLRADRDRLEKEFKEIERKIRAWQRDIHDNEDDADEFDFVFDRIYEILAEHRKEEE